MARDEGLEFEGALRAQIFREHTAAFFPETVPPEWLPPKSASDTKQSDALHSELLRDLEECSALLRRKYGCPICGQSNSAASPVPILPAEIEVSLSLDGAQTHVYGDPASTEAFAQWLQSERKAAAEESWRRASRASEIWFLKVFLPSLMPQGMLTQGKIDALKSRAERLITKESAELESWLRRALDGTTSGRLVNIKRSR